MQLKRLLLLGAIFITLETLSAQDIHATLFNMTPLTLNPALTGAYEGTARIGGMYRDQWRSFVPNAFTRPTIYVDAPIIRGFRKTDWVGVGLMNYSDKAGSGKLGVTASMLSLSYHFAMDKAAKNVLTLGLQGGQVQRSFGDKESLKFADAITSGLPTEETGFDDVSYLDFNAGLMLRSTIQDNTALEIGLAFNHITQPKYNFQDVQLGTDDGALKRPMRIVAHSKYETDLTDKWSIAPTVLAQLTGGATEVVLQGWGGYQINQDYKLDFGLGYRFGDSGQLLLGADYQKQLKVAFGYDLNVSSLNVASKYQGGFEIAAYYIFKIYKKPDTPAIICPHF
ncbi:MAG: PorP/SprF family type IX secretion system membrane protein [Saprospiraceae bacterium]|nr:PorP/SprF family type IX secretion system membrane protein [Saprospiraceae bacterium]